MTTLYSIDTQNRWNWNGLQNTEDNIILMLVLSSMFLILPAFFLGALSWAGIQVGNAVQNSARVGSQDTKSTTSSGMNMVGLGQVVKVGK